MRQFLSSLVAISLLAVAAGLPLVAYAQDSNFAASRDPSPRLVPQIPSLNQIVILKNGGVLRGKVTQTPERVIVENDQGSRLVIALDQFDFVCNDLVDAYWKRSARVQASDLKGQAELFRWCLKHKLFAQAQNQIDLLAALKGEAAQLASLSRALNVAVAQSQPRQRSANDSRSSSGSSEAMLSQGPEMLRRQAENSVDRFPPALLEPQRHVPDRFSPPQLSLDERPVFRPLPRFESDVASSSSDLSGSQRGLMPLPMPSNVNPPELQFDAKVRQVGFDDPLDEVAAQPASAIPAADDGFSERSTRQPVAQADVDSAIKALPNASFAHYRNRVERKLLLGCSAAKCHDSSATTFPLMHSGFHQKPMVSQSKRNLYQVLTYTNRADPESSPVLTIATQAHGGGVAPPFHVDSEDYELLRRWLVFVGDPNASSPVAAGRPATVQNMAVPALPLSENSSSQVASFPKPHQPTAASPLQPQEQTATPWPADLPTTIGEIPQLESNGNGFVPRDPFDPEIFNRKYRTRK